jgi:formylglycine-generating enzyme required for sulfatase activity
MLLLGIGGGVLLGGVLLAVLLSRPGPKPADSRAGGAESRALSNSLGMKLVPVPAGTFAMGSLDSEPGAEPDETPQHAVAITRPFYLGAHEVTQKQFWDTMGKNPSRFAPGKGGGWDHPVENVTWHEAKRFCEVLSQREGRKYRLPTEAEWEYACRAGSRTPYWFGSDARDLGPFAWFAENSDKRTRPVGTRQANVWGLHDMYGNVGEWCSDYYDRAYYKSKIGQDPQGPDRGEYRVWRGGSWDSYSGKCRSATRDRSRPDTRSPEIGFRVVLETGGSR